MYKHVSPYTNTSVSFHVKCQTKKRNLWFLSFIVLKLLTTVVVNILGLLLSKKQWSSIICKTTSTFKQMWKVELFQYVVNAHIWDGNKLVKLNQAWELWEIWFYLECHDHSMCLRIKDRQESVLARQHKVQLFCLQQPYVSAWWVRKKARSWFRATISQWTAGYCPSAVYSSHKWSWGNVQPPDSILYWRGLG